MWSSDPTITRQLPVLYRMLVGYWGLVGRLLPSRRARPPGGAALGRLVVKVSTRLGLRTKVALRIDGRILHIDLADLRFAMVIGELTGGGTVAGALRGLLGPGDTYIDAGANSGGYVGYAIGLIGPTGIVIAFEPQPRLAALVAQTLASNDVNGEVHQVALGDARGTVTLRVPEGRTGEASIHATEGEAIDVTLARLDDLVPVQLPGRVVMKIDVEGHEIPLLRGALNAIRRHRPTLIIEINPAALTDAGLPERALLDWLDEHDFRIAELGHPDRWLAPGGADPGRQRDVLAQLSDAA
ncbi:MAG: hypothetical protein QOE11_3651 [Solirubrobacteraceae bacterium]|jgi:FkbM family methyltransferase|nr:hypothetical protein [Solirubrobacteraceae bacterium]